MNDNHEPLAEIIARALYDNHRGRVSYGVSKWESASANVKRGWRSMGAAAAQAQRDAGYKIILPHVTQEVTDDSK